MPLFPLASPSPNRTAVVTVPKVPQSPFSFGSITIMDNPITSGPTRDSPLLGWSQGFYSGASQLTFALLMAMNLVFVGGEYDGSTLAVMGRNEVPLKVRELLVISGTGVCNRQRGRG
ncbi:Dirigent protein 22 [Linum perenne]